MTFNGPVRITDKELPRTQIDFLMVSNELEGVAAPASTQRELWRDHRPVLGTVCWPETRQRPPVKYSNKGWEPATEGDRLKMRVELSRLAVDQDLSWEHKVKIGVQKGIA